MIHFRYEASLCFVLFFSLLLFYLVLFWDWATTSSIRLTLLLYRGLFFSIVQHLRRDLKVAVKDRLIF